MASKRIIHDNNPVMNWAISNMVIDIDAAGNVKPNKKKVPNKIDPVVASLTGFFTYMSDLQGQNIYQSRGAMVI
ncbi:hypothetical protein GPAL_1721 [Glaciecola pallidula DSM 14239 = ACAM 615]|uniref:Terminase large subunit-like endonuclease domain-containing protein n=1 Tax=Brumicola pallidula DSM 14239 = ACAM 615 TaxID=1121922 RepID=K6Y724_9ALTE|nr:hypothetical protein GPAL_1721 [Glaciecola pallidula DSM 14239 = ACAM 615]